MVSVFTIKYTVKLGSSQYKTVNYTNCNEGKFYVQRHVLLMTLNLFTSTVFLSITYGVIQNDCWGTVYSCTDGSRNSQSFLL